MLDTLFLINHPKYATEYSTIYDVICRVIVVLTFCSPEHIIMLYTGS